MFHNTLATDFGFGVLWLVLGGLAYTVLSMYMALNHPDHIKNHPGQGFVLLVASLLLGALSLALVFLAFLFGSMLQEFLYAIGVNDDIRITEAARNLQHDVV